MRLFTRSEHNSPRVEGSTRFLLNLFFNTILASMPEWSILGKTSIIVLRGFSTWDLNLQHFDCESNNVPTELALKSVKVKILVTSCSADSIQIIQIQKVKYSTNRNQSKYSLLSTNHSNSVWRSLSSEVHVLYIFKFHWEWLCFLLTIFITTYKAVNDKIVKFACSWKTLKKYKHSPYLDPKTLALHTLL